MLELSKEMKHSQYLPVNFGIGNINLFFPIGYNSRNKMMSLIIKSRFQQCISVHKFNDQQNYNIM